MFRTSRLSAGAAKANRPGFALESTLVVMILVGAIVALATTWVVTTQRTTGVDYRGARVQHAAEAGADAIMAQLELAMQDGVLRQTEIDALKTPELDGFDFEQLDVTYTGAAEARTIQSGTFKGLFALNQPVEIAVSARDENMNSASVVVRVNAQSIPLFQFGVFYQDDLEIHPGANMFFEGWVHTNGNLYLSSNTLYFQSLITTPGKLFHRRKNNTEKLNGVYINDASGSEVALTFDSESASDPATFRANSLRDFDSRLMTDAHSVSDLRLPLPTGVPPIAMIQPRYGSDDADTRDVKFAWKADWYIQVDVSQIDNICPALTSGAYQWVRKGSLGTPNASQCTGIFSGKKSAFYDRREQRWVDVLNLDVGALRSWIAASSGRDVEILYVTFVNSGSRYSALRVRNGSRLPGPITIASDRPLYVQDDFNTIGWQPASLLGDAITFLSPSWDDSKQGTSALRTASAMDVYAAVAAGHSATPCDWKTGICGPTPTNPPNEANGNYGGGLENFPRFLESWSGRKFLYRGSLVSLFQSQYAAQRRWRTTGEYYNAPIRDWEFDLRFQDPRNLPPGTPTVGSVLQTAFRPVF
ncbi:MAG TPA: hypothetical protein VKZ41_01245 [Gemmatimonadales bacterium]|nr:hypothetical protein [Gemmatimonadales bacterium]